MRSWLGGCLLALLILSACGGAGSTKAKSEGETASDVVATDSSDSDETTTTKPTTTTLAVNPLGPTAGLLRGTEALALPPGTPGELSVIVQAVALDPSGSLPIVVRNM